ncbi:MAG: DUF1211 domain-containing protein [Solirubrobacterales bacterium]|nr:DUF1211 domain-containing protein [Solirubrobacterales bacterium]
MFAIALTLLVLNLDPPDYSSDFWGEIGDIAPALFTYALSFIVLGPLWIHHHAFFRDVRRIDTRLTMLNLAYLGFVAFVPYPTGLIGDHGQEAAPTVIYAFTIGMTTLLALLLRVYADRNDLLEPGSGQAPALSAVLVPMVFFASIPLAFINAELAKYFWLTLIFVGRIRDGSASESSGAAD